MTGGARTVLAGTRGLFPKWVFPNLQTSDYLAEIEDRLGDYYGALEFRNNVGMNAENQEETLALLGDLRCTCICVDEPARFQILGAIHRRSDERHRLRPLPPAQHGDREKRNKTSAERFDYHY